MANATRNTNWDISVDLGKVGATNTSKTLTIATAGTFVDKNIVVGVSADALDAATLGASATGSATISSATVGTKENSKYPITGSAGITGTASASTTASGYATKDTTIGTGNTTGTANLNASLDVIGLSASGTANGAGSATIDSVTVGDKKNEKYPITGSKAISGSVSGTASAVVTSDGYGKKGVETGSGSVTGTVSGTASLSSNLDAIKLSASGTANGAGSATIDSVTVGAIDTRTNTYPITGSKAISGSVSGTASAAVTSDGYGKKGVETGSGSVTGTVSGTASLDASLPVVSYLNKLPTGKAETDYPDISESAPALISGSYLYINEGYTKNQKISLAKLVPDDANISVQDGAPYIRKNKTVYDSNGKLITGSMDNATVKSGTASISAVSVGALDATSGKYPITATIDVTGPTVTTAGYISSSDGTKNANNSQSKSYTGLDAAVCTVAGGGLTAGNGSSSINVNGLISGTTVSSTDKISLEQPTTAPTSGYYKIGTTGKGTVNRAAITDKHTAGWLPTKAETNVSDATSLDSNSGTSTYWVKKSTGATTNNKASFTPSTAKQTLTISAGYYPSDRTIEVAAMTNGVISSADSAISSVSATAGTSTVDTENWKYKIPLTLSASGTAYAKITTNGYLTDKNNTSTSLSLKKENAANVEISLFDGAYTIV